MDAPSAPSDRGKADRGPGALSWLFCLSLTIGLYLIIRVHGSPTGWPWVLAAIPPLMVGQHAFYLYSVKGRSVVPQRGAKTVSFLVPNFESLEGAWRRYFGPGQIILRFGVPAVLLACACVLQAGIFFGGWFPRLTQNDAFGQQLLSAGRLGLAGAYAYVMVHLGTRNFRADLTGGGAMWCAITVFIGPGIALVAALVLPLKESETFARTALYFFAGLAPQKVIGVISDSARKALGGSLSPAVLNNKSLLAIRGITLDIEERLREEGIEDAYGLAFAEPYHLVRNTNFSPRQVLAWMDESLLYFFLPDTAEWLIRQHGLTGAIDLAYLGSQAANDKPDGPAAKSVAGLCQKTGMSADEFAMLLQRMLEDQQLIQIWNLYNSLDIWPSKAFEPGN